MNLLLPASLRRCAYHLLVSTSLALALAPVATAQNPTPETRPAEITQTIFLVHATGHDISYIETDLRYMLPKSHVYGVDSQNAITVKGTQEEIAEAQRIVSTLDRPRHVYRLTYTITGTDSGKEPTTQRVSLIVLPGSKTVLKQGTRVPIATGTTKTETNASDTQVQYVDLGLNIDSSVEGSPDDLRLQTHIEQSGIVQEQTVMGVQDPVIRQTNLESNVLLTQGKPLAIGSLDLPGSNGHEEVTVVAEMLR